MLILGILVVAAVLFGLLIEALQPHRLLRSAPAPAQRDRPAQLFLQGGPWTPPGRAGGLVGVPVLPNHSAGRPPRPASRRECQAVGTNHAR